VVRIAREAIVNAARHGGAQNILVVLDRSGDQVRLQVSDDGRGAPQAKLRGLGGHGLQVIRARAAALGGRLAIWQRAAGGLELEVTFPVAQPFKASAVRAHRVRDHSDAPAGATRAPGFRRGMPRGFAR
jgi:nitrate/nitrite-specific signal transduction histidine kinase